MMAASGRGIRGKGGREGAGAGAPLESAGSEGDRAAGTRRWRAGGAPRCRGWREKTAARGTRGREPGWRACASPGRGEGGASWGEGRQERAVARGAAHTGAVSSRRERGRESSR
uniref:Uncharacterized protein n=1 Tax=Rhinopithecus roxellana TaxID=61622 RepID=A0A2K6RRK1_RHIRO